MADPASKYTDDQIAVVEKQLKSVYNQAYKDILQKQKDFNAKHQKKVDKYLKKVADGKMTQEQYDNWLKGQVFQGKQWEDKKKQMLAIIYNSNKVATDIMNEKTHGVFAFNATYANYDMEHGAGVNFGFGIYDTVTVSNLIKNDPKLLPEWKIDQPKDYKWNQKKLNKQISLGIVEGESLDKIAHRLCDSLCTQNFNKMRTFARTAMTGAQNSGRLFSYEHAKGLGIKVKKQWMATLDNHTRISHQQLDGQIQDTDKPFEVGGMKIKYPGDPTAAAALVFNCRCTMVSEIEDYPSTYDRYDNIDGKPIKQMTYSEWLDAKAKGEDISPVPLTFSHIVHYEVPKEFTDLFGSKKMSNLYNDMKTVDTKAANKFYNELKSYGKPSEVWQQYMNGTLSADQAKKIETMLKEYADKAGLIKPPVNYAAQFADKKMSNMYNDIKAVDTKTANQFYNELKSMGKPSEIWQQYLDGKLDKASTEKINALLEQYSNKMGSVKPVDKTKDKTADKDIPKPVDPNDIKTLEQAQEALKKAQEEINKSGANKVFKGIWKDDVTYADYESKKAGIAAKKQYYIDQIANAEANGWHAKADILKDFLEELKEFESNGSLFSKLFKNLDALKDKILDLTPKPSINATGKILNADLFTEKAKNNIRKFKNLTEADKHHRKYLDSIWDNLTEREKYGVWEYTRNSNPMNKPLSGYHESWSRNNFLGLGNTDWGNEDSWRSLPSKFKKFGQNGHCTYHQAIIDCTKAIEKSVLPEGTTLVRGSEKDGLAGLIEGKVFSYAQAEKILNGDIKDIKKAFEGQVVQNHAFTSTGIISGTGFGGAVSYEIYAPKGTKGIYAEPQSYYGHTISDAEIYKTGKPYSGVGYEAEIILQRGTEYRITNIEKIGSRLHVKMEVVAQPDYFKYGDEETYNAGQTRHKT